LTCYNNNNNDNNNDNNNNQNNNTEVIVTLKIPKNYYKAGYAISHLLGFESFDEYVSDVVMSNVDMDLDGGGSLNIEDSKKMLLMEEND
jgi:hypothetical protein